MMARNMQSISSNKYCEFVASCWSYIPPLDGKVVVAEGGTISDSVADDGSDVAGVRLWL
jgi:hypothetical protein